MNYYLFPSRLLSAFMLLILSACSSTPTSDSRYFSLTPLQTPSVEEGTIMNLSLGIGPIEIPRLLNRPQIVYRKSTNEIFLSEDNQWAGSIREEIQDVLIERAIEISGSGQVFHYPWARDLKPEFQARVRIDRLDGELGQSVILEAHWDLVRQKDMTLITSKKTRYQVDVKQRDFLSYVIAQQSALSQLSDDILSEIKHYQASEAE